MNRSIVLLAGLTVACCLASPAEAAIQPSSDLLLPYFEVDLQGGSGRTTLFALCNHSEKPVEVLVSVHTNWGIPVLDVSLKLEADQVRTVNLRDWLLAGDLPDRKLGVEEIAHLQAALSGRASPRDQLYSSTEVEPGLAVGSITFRVRGVRRPEVLWGDFFLLDPAEDHLQAEPLVSLGRSSVRPECLCHGVRFLAGGDFEAGTELVIWTSRRVEPSSSPELADTSRLRAEVEVYSEAGRVIGHHRMSLLPVQKVDVATMELSEPFGWFDLVTEAESIVTVRYGMGGRAGVPVETLCLPAEPLQIGPALRIEQLVNGEEAAVPPGPPFAVGSPIRWMYTVTNACTVSLDSIVVANSLGVPVACPENSLGPGKTMTCTASSLAEVCAHAVTATATGVPPFGSPVQAEDTAYYTGDEGAAIEVELLVDLEEADEPPGPYLMFRWQWPPYSVPVYWSFRVTNPGSVPLVDLSVSSDVGVAPLCPSTSLAPGESMECRAQSEILPGPQVNVGKASGTTACGFVVSATDPAHYVGEPSRPALRLESLIDGQDADEPPGPAIQVGTEISWTLLVANMGNEHLDEIVVMNGGMPISCPSTLLAAGDTMVCTARTFAGAGQQRVEATVRGVAFRIQLTPHSIYTSSASASDLTYYVGISPL